MTKKTEIESVTMALSTPIEFANGGALDKAFEIEIFCHSKKQYKKVMFLEQVMSKAFFDLQKMFTSVSDAVPEDDEEPTDDDNIGVDKKQVLLALNMTSIDLEAVYDRFEALAKTGVIKVEGHKINEMQMDNMDPVDIKGALAEYIVNFIMPSVIESFG